MEPNREIKTLGQKLRELREAYGLSQNQVAAALNLDRSTYSNYELDKTNPSLESLVKLARIFCVPKESLLPDDDGGGATFRDIIRSDGMVQSLNKEERSLIVLYRSLSAAQKEELKRQAHRIVDGKEKDEA